jgi:hypothetical protein
MDTIRTLGIADANTRHREGSAELINEMCSQDFKAERKFSGSGTILNPREKVLNKNTKSH